jgi:hypothetical protein
MVCPNCGEIAYRSHTRNFRESFIKRLSPLRTYRCHDCGWRGYAAPARVRLPRVNFKALFVWIAGVLLAVVIGYVGADMITSERPPIPRTVGAP